MRGKLYNKLDEQRLEKQTKNILEAKYQAGRISERTYKGTKGVGVFAGREFGQGGVGGGSKTAKRAPSGAATALTLPLGEYAKKTDKLGDYESDEEVL